MSIGEHEIAKSIDRLTKAMESIATAMNPEPVKPMGVNKAFGGTAPTCVACGAKYDECICE